ncbi:hypothetical protein I6N90_21760 [Paenibacillus sp. GSMTC-2017]|uniref:DUF6602 domain-containing protein n=1 Tax=Paenibacillus sp. GSMTC-2017 TaxID=2794350 RepID=UPI0018D63068|nr:DUF6602 domain-containing protein [Paenibacillus sp. GSMTC-2017]MBH5320424.1 hypothetical protein [Paenibacillus sp. GSMTC-2017]
MTDNKEEIGAPRLDIMKKIVGNYRLLERNIVEELDYTVDHHLTAGIFREGVWKKMFEQMIPRKFAIEQSVFIVDSESRVSKEVDLVIFDEQYTPYIFRYGNIKYIPIEAVAVVVQCKSTNVVFDELEKWVKSINCLRTSPKSVVRTAQAINYGEDQYNKYVQYYESLPKVEVGQENDQKYSEFGKELNKQGAPKTTQTSTRPITILCHTAEAKSASISNLFDITICRSTDPGKLSVTIMREHDSIKRWSHKLNHVSDRDKGEELFGYINENEKNVRTLNQYRVKGKSQTSEEISLLSLTFQLNQLLMLINNPIFFPHMAYVDMFNSILEDKKTNSGVETK